jgi:hypothetical protein
MEPELTQILKTLTAEAKRGVPCGIYRGTQAFKILYIPETP